jgi:uncharacterized OB-fold protein
MSNQRKIPAPIPHPETQAYWDAAQQQKLLVRRCRACGEAHHYPREICPFCWSNDTEWIEAKGEAEIYSFSTMRVGPAPYTLAYVTLVEGPRMMTNIVDCDPDKLSIGQKVKVVFRPCDDGKLAPMFTP